MNIIGFIIFGLIIGLFGAVGAVLFGLPYPLIIGVVAGVTELIPMVGPVLGAILLGVLALLTAGGAWQMYRQAQEHADLAQKKVLKEVAAPMLVFAVALNEAGDMIDTVGRVFAKCRHQVSLKAE